jgi:pentatricopeptide repeat protein
LIDTVNPFLAACARAGEWPHALRLFADMKSDRIKFDVVAYNALISAFMNGGKPDMVRRKNKITV